MESCDGCQKWRLWLQQPENLSMKRAYNDPAYLLIHKSADSFLAAVRGGCKLCKYVRASILRKFSDDELYEEEKKNIAKRTPRKEPIGGEYNGRVPPSGLMIVVIWLYDGGLVGKNLRARLDVVVSPAPNSTSSDRRARFRFHSMLPSIQSVPTQGTVDPSSDLQLLKRRLAYCEENHASCRAKSSKTYTPTRLLYVGTFESPTVCLWWKGNDINIAPYRYAVLSHCWGGQLLYRLERNNLAQFQQSISEERLPQTFQDAIYTARYFGVEYLWIDALCIIQDDDNDWERESTKMCDVYQNACFNISASYARDSSGGLFNSRLSIDPEIPVDVWRSQKGLIRLVMRHDEYTSCFLTSEHLYSRGWVVQEQYLSTRRLHFTSSQVFWECEKELSCQNYPTGLPSYDHSSDVRSAPRSDKEDIKDIEETQASFSYPEWRNLIEKYSRCNLTRHTDKLVAIQGLIEMLKRENADHFFAEGLWLNDPTTELLWSVPTWEEPGSIMRPSEYRAPTWSWASLDCHVGWFFCETPGLPLLHSVGVSPTKFPSDSGLEVRPAHMEVTAVVMEFFIHTFWDHTRYYLATIPKWPSLNEIKREFQSLQDTVNSRKQSTKYKHPAIATTIVKVISQFRRLSASLSPDTRRNQHESAAHAFAVWFSSCTFDREVYFDSDSDAESFASASKRNPASAWFLPVRICSPCVVHGLLLRRFSDENGEYFSRLGFCMLDYDDTTGTEGEDFGDLMALVFKRFFLGQMLFQQEQPDMFRARKIRLV